MNLPNTGRCAADSTTPTRVTPWPASRSGLCLHTGAPGRTANRRLPPQRRWSDKAGAYRLGNLPAGAFCVQYVPGGDYLYPGQYPEVVVRVAGGRAVEGLDFALRRGLVVEGRVLDQSGLPVVSATVSDWSLHREETTDAEGRFRLAGYRHGHKVRLAASAEGYAPTKPEAFRVKADGLHNITITLGPGGDR